MFIIFCFVLKKINHHEVIKHYLLTSALCIFMLSECAISQTPVLTTPPYFAIPAALAPATTELIPLESDKDKVAEPTKDAAKQTAKDSAAKDATKDKAQGEKKDLPAQDAKKADSHEKKEKKWYDKISLRGYTQIRTAETIYHKDGTADPQLIADRSAGDYQNFLIRRARLILYGDISENLYVYFQPDFAGTPSNSPDQTFFPQLRDWYGDVYLTTDKEHRIRIGQSKVPYGFENMQSSQNRVTFDRTDAINSGVARNERDLGLFYYWTPEDKQKLFKRLVDDGLKGSGNYGLFGIGVYNGQGGSFLEQNNNLHAVIRGTYPFEFDNGHIIEASIQAYTGKSSTFGSAIRPLGTGSSLTPANTIDSGFRNGLTDERIGFSTVWYPQPLGFQAEWNIGRGPGLSDNQRRVEVRSLHGGYAMVMYKHDTPRMGTFVPFAQWTYYKGGIRSERNAPYLDINEWHLGCEWQIQKALEFTLQYTHTDRTNTTAINTVGLIPYRQFVGGFLRAQFQINY